MELAAVAHGFGVLVFRRGFDRCIQNFWKNGFDQRDQTLQNEFETIFLHRPTPMTKNSGGNMFASHRGHCTEMAHSFFDFARACDGQVREKNLEALGFNISTCVTRPRDANTCPSPRSGDAISWFQLFYEIAVSAVTECCQLQRV